MEFVHIQDFPFLFLTGSQYQENLHTGGPATGALHLNPILAPLNQRFIDLS
jgi:hypothetical protein